MKADLHVHTSASDGFYSPAEVINLAAAADLGAVAIVDHDTLDGIPAARLHGLSAGVEVLPGVEISTVDGLLEVHILGYFPGPVGRTLLDHLARFRNARQERVLRIIANLEGLGIHLDPKRVMAIAGGGSMGRPHIARALVEAGAAGTVEDAFRLYLDRGRPAYVPRYKFAPGAAVRLVREAGGSAVLAHPGQSGCGGLIPRLMGDGLQGLEVYHPSHSPQDTSYYFEVCKKHNLLPTGGSDFHGGSNTENSRLGSFTVPLATVERLKELAAL